MATSGRNSPNKVRQRVVNGEWPGRPVLSANPSASAIVYTYGNWISFTFISSGTLNVSDGVSPGTFDAFLIGGGTPGSVNPTTSGGPGGPGGRFTTVGGTLYVDSSYPVVVGGVSSDSSFLGFSTSTGSSRGGGSGGISAPGSSGQGGVPNSYRLGVSEFYGGGGGGGGAYNPVSGSPRAGGSGGVGGGGAGGYGATAPSGPPKFINYPNSTGASGSISSGGGGGGGGGGSFYVGSGAGGSGVVIIRVPASQFRVN